MTGNTSANLFEQQQANRRRTAWLVAAFVLFFAWLGFGGDVLLWYATAGSGPEGYHHVFPWFGLLLTVIASGVAWHGYRTGPENVLWSTGARELTAVPATAPAAGPPIGGSAIAGDPGAASAGDRGAAARQPLEPSAAARDPEAMAREAQLVNVVEEMAIAAGVPKPRIWIVPDSDPNAFATGLDPMHAHVAVTEGLLRTCSRDELQAVIAHELGHVKNFDTRLMTTLAALVGAVVLMHDGVGRVMRGGMWMGGRGGRGGGSRGGRRSDAGGVVVMVLLVVWLISWLLAPLITQLLAMAVSRKREYLADAMGAQFTRNPLALASALEKLEAASAPTASIKQGAAHLCIVDPAQRSISDREGRIADVFATHPPIAKRVALLRAMGYEPAAGAPAMTHAGS